jgi:inhibitor of cysteine peptidase
MTPFRLIAPLSLALLAACAQQPRQNVTLEKQTDCPIQLKSGQNLILSLPSSPATGYRWAIQDSAGGVLRSLGPEVYHNPDASDLLGASGVSTWRFQAFASGSGRLRLTYQQPWAPEEPSAQVFDCPIKVD